MLMPVPALLLLLMISLPTAAWDAGRLPVPLLIQSQKVPYPVFAIYPMPGEALSVRWGDAMGGRVRYLGTDLMIADARLRAPAKPGLTVMEVTREDDSASAKIHVLTRVPATQVRAELLEGYRIGSYPERPLRGQEIYRPPPGFIRVTDENARLAISPNFRLGQFVSKQSQGYPKFVVLRPELLLKLETILTQLNRRGYPTDGLVIMSGYRTPYYNRAIGNVQYSRHVWGGAADIYIDDRPRDGRMDDLNRDGRVNFEDARWFSRFVDGLSTGGLFEERIGGLGAYSATSAHGPFIHVDVRGKRSRW